MQKRQPLFDIVILLNYFHTLLVLPTVLGIQNV